MKPWDSWINDITQNESVKRNQEIDDVIRKTSISGNVDGAYMATPPNIRPPDFNKPEKKRPPERGA